MAAASLLLSVLLCSCVLNVCSAENLDNKLLAHSDFVWDDDGWVVGGEGAEAMSIGHTSRLVKAADDGKSVWYFAAPTKFLGDKRAAYGGTLSYRLGFFEYDSAGADMVVDYDIVLASEKYGLRVGIKNVVKPWTFNSDYTVALSEASPWVTLPGGIQRPSKPELQRLFGSLSAILIRGGYYQGHEDTYLGDVKLQAGAGAPEQRRSSVISSKVLQSADGVGTSPDSEGDVVSSITGRGVILSVTTKDKLVKREGVKAQAVPLVDVMDIIEGADGATMDVIGASDAVLMTLGEIDSYPADELAIFLEALKVRADAARSSAKRDDLKGEL